ncbi:hypothetical protein [Streptomyces atratus]
MFGREFDRQQMRRLSKVTEAGHERIPVFRVGLTSNTTLRTLNRMICEYYGHPATDRANAAALASSNGFRPPRVTEGSPGPARQAGRNTRPAHVSVLSPRAGQGG